MLLFGVFGVWRRLTVLFHGAHRYKTGNVGKLKDQLLRQSVASAAARGNPSLQGKTVSRTV